MVELLRVSTTKRSLKRAFRENSLLSVPRARLTRLFDVVVEVLVVYDDRAVSVVRRVRGFPILVLVEGLLVLVESDVAQETIVEIARQGGELRAGVPVVELLDPVGHQGGVLLRGAVGGFRRQVLMIAGRDRALGAERAGKVLPLPVTRDY